MGLDASVVERVDRQPAPEGHASARLLRPVRDHDVPAQVRVNPPRLRVEVDGRTVDGVSLFVQNAENYTYFNDRAGAAGRGCALRLRRLAGIVLTRARPYDVPTVTLRALSGAARIAKHKRIDAFGGFDEAVARSPTGARSRSRSTATTSTT